MNNKSCVLGQFLVFGLIVLIAPACAGGLPAAVETEAGAAAPLPRRSPCSDDRRSMPRLSSLQAGTYAVTAGAAIGPAAGAQVAGKITLDSITVADSMRHCIARGLCVAVPIGRMEVYMAALGAVYAVDSQEVDTVTASLIGTDRYAHYPVTFGPHGSWHLGLYFHVTSAEADRFSGTWVSFRPPSGDEKVWGWFCAVRRQ